MTSSHRNGRKRPRATRAWAAWAACMVAGVAVDLGGAATPSYVRDVAPVLQRHCTGCHHPGKPKGDVDLTTVAAMRRAGRHGAAVVAGKPGESVLMSEVQGAEPAMPKEGPPLSAAQARICRISGPSITTAWSTKSR